jgi:hypothetical protein
MRPWATNTRKKEKKGKAVHFPKHRRSAPRVPRSGTEATPPPDVDREGSPLPVAYSVELLFNHEGKETGVDDAQICLSQKALRDLIEEYNEMGITFSLLVVIVQGESDREEALPPGKLTKRWKRFILDQAARPRVTVAVAGYAPNPHEGNAVEPACLYIRSNHPRM